MDTRKLYIILLLSLPTCTFAEEQLKTLVDSLAGNGWPWSKHCFPTSASEALFSQEYTPDFREKMSKKLMTGPPKDVEGEFNFKQDKGGFKCEATITTVKVGPVTQLELPEVINMTDMDGKSISILNGDGTRLSTSNLHFGADAHAKVHVSCSVCAFSGISAALGWGESRAAENCGTWLKYCDVHGKIRMRSSGKMRVQAEECLDASLLSVASCISDLQSCMYASATGGRANITDFEVKVSHLEGDRLCAIAGITEDYVNDLLKDERAAFEEKLNSELALSFVDSVNLELNASNIKPYENHP